jgi:hypothetical protein
MTPVSTLVRYLLAEHRAQLSAKETTFLTSLAGWQRPYSDKQIKWLQDIADRVTRQAPSNVIPFPGKLRR